MILKMELIEAYLEENEVDDVEEEFGTVEPKQLVTGLQKSSHEGPWEGQSATGLHCQRCYNVLQLCPYG